MIDQKTMDNKLNSLKRISDDVVMDIYPTKNKYLARLSFKIKNKLVVISKNATSPHQAFKNACNAAFSYLRKKKRNLYEKSNNNFNHHIDFTTY